MRGSVFWHKRRVRTPVGRCGDGGVDAVKAQEVHVVTIDFCKVPIDPGQAKQAAESAHRNWSWWESDFRHRGDFKDLPIFENYPRWRGFGADFSVFRGIPTDALDTLRLWFAERPNPQNLESLHEALLATLPGWNRISLTSKLLAIWKPTEFAMWDRYAREGLRSLHSVRGHRYNRNNASQYEVFKADFFALMNAKLEDLLKYSQVDPREFQGFEKEFSCRLLDNYLVVIGKALNKGKS